MKTFSTLRSNRKENSKKVTKKKLKRKNKIYILKWQDKLLSLQNINHKLSHEPTNMANKS